MVGYRLLAQRLDEAHPDDLIPDVSVPHLMVAEFAVHLNDVGIAFFGMRAEQSDATAQRLRFCLPLEAGVMVSAIVGRRLRPHSDLISITSIGMACSELIMQQRIARVMPLLIIISRPMPRATSMGGISSVENPNSLNWSCSFIGSAPSGLIGDTRSKPG